MSPREEKVELFVVDRPADGPMTTRLVRAMELRSDEIILKLDEVEVPFDRRTGKSKYDGPYKDMSIRRDHLRALRRYKG